MDAPLQNNPPTASTEIVVTSGTELPRKRRRRKRKRAMAHSSREHRRRRLRRHGRRAYVRSVYFLPSMATLGNAICGFAAIYVAALDKTPVNPSPDRVTDWF